MNNIITRTKREGFLAGIRYIRIRIYSTTEYYVLRNSMDDIPEIKSEQFDEFQIIELTDPDSDLFHEMYRVWPLETRPGDIQCVAEVLRERSKNGAMCFVILLKDKVVGANWLYLPDNYYLHFDIPFLPGEYISTWTFVVSEYRGIGVGKFLKRYSLNMAKQRGVTSLINLTSVKNTPSIKMYLSSGSRIIGSVMEKYRWFKYSHSFSPVSGKESI